MSSASRKVEIDAASVPANDNDAATAALDILARNVTTKADAELIIRELASRALTRPVRDVWLSALQIVIGTRRPRHGKVGRPAHDDAAAIEWISEKMKRSGLSRRAAIIAWLDMNGPDGTSRDSDFERLKSKLQKSSKNG